VSETPFAVGDAGELKDSLTTLTKALSDEFQVSIDMETTLSEVRNRVTLAQTRKALSRGDSMDSIASSSSGPANLSDIEALQDDPQFKDDPEFKTYLTRIHTLQDASEISRKEINHVQQLTKP
jgi:hypothetical protein